MLKEDNLQNKVGYSQNLASSDKPVTLDYAPIDKISRIEKIIILATVIGGVIIIGAVSCYPVLKYLSDSYFAKEIQFVFP